jgi:protein tyrosine phosphatase
MGLVASLFFQLEFALERPTISHPPFKIYLFYVKNWLYFCKPQGERRRTVFATPKYEVTRPVRKLG